MSILINAHQITKSFGTKRLFKNLSFSIHEGERIGLIGPNGAGKSTLLKMIYAESDTESAAHPDSGDLSFKNGIRIGFLDQVPRFKPDATILTGVLNPKDLEDWEKLNLAREFISRFELDRWEDETKVSSLSGGWQKRLALIRELVKQPDLLLLDEPTNHLDIESILLLENFLARSPFATLTITHDRAFLQNVANRIIEINPRHEGGMLSVNGDYVQFLETRELLIHSQERAETVLKNTLRRETEWLRRGAKARTTKQQARINRHGDLSETVEDLNARNQTKKARIDFISTEKSPKKLVEVVNLGKTFGSKEIFSDINLILNPGTRLGLLGPNGIGKSTFINVLLGIEKPTTGSVTLAENLKISYFDQSRRSLDPLLTVKETVCPTGDHVQFQGNSVHIRSYLDRFLFTHAQTDMKVGS